MKTVGLNDKPAFLALSYSWKQDKSLASLFAIGNEHIIRNRSWNATQDLRAMLGQPDSVRSDERDIKNMEILGTVYSEDSIKELWRQTIFCDGKSITIQQNMYNALLYLRKSRPGDYWINAMCIDQENINEKSAQVQMMGRIYRFAAGVVVWLGNVPVLPNEGMQKVSQKLATCTG
jgi:hypothetical protein